MIMEEKLGTRFGNYELIRRIDVGGMGEVYQARQLTAFGRTVAIKIIRSDLVHDITARARFLREAEVSAHLKHEHILTLLDFGEVDGRLYLVTPYIEGGNLATCLQRSAPLSLVETRKLFVPLVQAVAYIHRRGVVHRDLKPTNIMLDMEDNEVYVRLIDFGIASLQGQSASPPLTTAGHEMGTVAYMAPERLSGIAAPSNDIFSLGMILHQMLTGRMPTVASPSPHSAVPRLPEPLARVVHRAILPNPAERYATAEDLLRAFEQACQQILSPRPAGSMPAFSETAVLAENRLMQRPSSASRPELISLAHSGEVPALTHAGMSSFSPEDYSAPTTSFQPFQSYQPPTPSRPPLIRPRPPRPRKDAERKPLVMVLSSAMILLLLVIAGMLYFGYQVVNATNVSVSFVPRVHVISQVITLKADPSAQTGTLANATIHAYALTSSKTMQQTGSTTGQVNCFFFGCQQGVDFTDVTGLENQMLPTLKQNITQDLLNQVRVHHGVEISGVNFSDPLISSDPQIGSPGKHVTVTVAEQGSVGYVLSSDETNAVNQSLTAAAEQLGPGYQIVSSTTNIGQPATRSIDPTSGVSSIAIPAGAVARYQFTQAQLQVITNALPGKSLADARSFLQSQPGIDPTSIAIHFTAGSSSTMPTDVQHIKLEQLGQGTFPTVSLTPVPGITPSPDPTAPPTDNGGQ